MTEVTRQTQALENIAAALQNILAEEIKQSGCLTRIATSNQCLCECCVNGSATSSALIEATMTHSQAPAEKRHAEFVKLMEGD